MSGIKKKDLKDASQVMILEWKKRRIKIFAQYVCVIIDFLKLIIHPKNKTLFITQDMFLNKSKLTVIHSMQYMIKTCFYG